WSRRPSYEAERKGNRDRRAPLSLRNTGRRSPCPHRPTRTAPTTGRARRSTRQRRTRIRNRSSTSWHRHSSFRRSHREREEHDGHQKKRKNRRRREPSHDGEGERAVGLGALLERERR